MGACPAARTVQVIPVGDRIVSVLVEAPCRSWSEFLTSERRAHSTRSRQTVKIESQASEVLDCRWNLQAGMPSSISCQAHGRRNAVPYGQQPACSPSAAKSSGAPSYGDRGFESISLQRRVGSELGSDARASLFGGWWQVSLISGGFPYLSPRDTCRVGLSGCRPETLGCRLSEAGGDGAQLAYRSRHRRA